MRIFIGTDQAAAKSDLVLEYTLRRHASIELDVVWMSLERPPGGIPWDIGREAGQPYTKPRRGWATDFTCFRWAVPELAGHEGRALYLDTDMAVFGDVAELLRRDMQHAWAHPGRPDVILFDCGHPFWCSDDWPTIVDMATSARGAHDYVAAAPPHDALPREWNETQRFHPEKTKLFHWTNMRTQPWRPWPEVFDYAAVGPEAALWEALYESAAT